MAAASEFEGLCSRSAETESIAITLAPEQVLALKAYACH